MLYLGTKESKKLNNILVFIVEKHKDRLEIFYFPAYCPDMNPQELVNQDVKANANNFQHNLQISTLLRSP